MTVDEDDAVTCLKSLGLSEYEAKVFIALQRLGVGTAREIYKLADVPRSQVYGAAESLEERGLLEIQQSNPMEYRPVDLEEARDLLRDRYRSKEDRAFDYLEEVHREAGDENEEREDFWTVKGRENIDHRVVEIVEDAQDRVVFVATELSLVTPGIEKSLCDASEKMKVYVMSESGEVRRRFSGYEEILVESTPEKIRRDDRGGRFVMTDGDTVLLSVLSDINSSGVDETAIWSSGTSFASVLTQLAMGWFSDFL
ncbi:MAG: TrmB family transcriptional regulator [Halobacteria archaeon]